MSYKLVVFDFDGTLLDTRKTIVYAKQQTMKQLGLPVLSDELCASTIGLSAYKGFKQLFPDASEETIQECIVVCREYFEKAKDEMPPKVFDGVMDTLNALKTAGIQLSIATSRNTPSLKGFLKSLDLETYFPYALGGNDTERLKPDPDPVFKTMQDLNIQAKDILVVGDMPFDIMMGSGAGCDTCGVTYGNATRNELNNAGATYVIDQIGDLLDIVL